MNRKNIESTYRVRPEDLNVLLETASGEITAPALLCMAANGAKSIVNAAKYAVSDALKTYGENASLTFPETAYALPLLYGWKGISNIDLKKASELLAQLPEPKSDTLEDGFVSGENAMYAAEIMEAIRYLDNKTANGEGFIPDRILRELGLSLVDETIPGAVLFLGSGDAKHIKGMVRSGQSKGMVMCISGDCLPQLRENGVALGWDRMFYPLGEFTATVHALNFAVRAAYSFGGVGEGERDKLKTYLSKRPKIIVVQIGPLTCLDAAFAFAALMHSAAIVTDQDLPEIPGAVKRCKDCGDMVQVGVEERGITVKLEPIDLPIAYGPAFEGEVIRKPDTFVEMGGTKSVSFELLTKKNENDVEDGKITVTGKEIDGFSKGDIIPFGIVIKVYGKDMQTDLESVVERNVHHFINYAEGVWHAGQRDSNWIRISDLAKERGFRFEHLGKILIHKIKEEFGQIITRIQVDIFTGESDVKRSLADAKNIYEQRDERLKGLTDDSVPAFYTCTMCQSFAPDHVCIVAPERLGLCGAINWLDAKASNELSPKGPNQPVSKGSAVDYLKGEWEGTNSIVRSQSHGNVERMCMYSLMDSPMTSCGCFEVIVAMTVDMQGVILVDRDYIGMTPVGMKFSTLAGSIGGGRQTPGFMGIGRKYLASKKFIAAEGGIIRVAWMPKRLKNMFAEEIQQRGAELGVPDLLDKIADETVTEDAEGLMAWMAEKEHPALLMSPLM